MSKVGWIAVAAGAVGSAGLTFYAGRHNPSAILMALFISWVVSPFVGLVLVSRRWPVISKSAVVITLGSLAVYAYVALGPPRAKIAFTFLAVPLVSWVVIGIAMLISFRQSARGS